MNIQWSSMLGMFGGLNSLTIEYAKFDQPGAENLFDVLFNPNLKSFALKKCKANDTAYQRVFDAL